MTHSKICYTLLVIIFSISNAFSQSYFISTLAGSGTSGSLNGNAQIARFNNPSSITVDPQGNIFIADANNHLIRKIALSGIVSTFAGTGASGSEDGQGNSASFNTPTAIVSDLSGNLFVADKNNHKIRKITPSGLVSTFAGSGLPGLLNGNGDLAQFRSPSGLTIDAQGYIFVTDTRNHCIRKITPSGKVSTLSGTGQPGNNNGIGALAEFYFPEGICLGIDQTIYVADRQNHKIRAITQTGIVSTLTGTGRASYADGSLANSMFSSPIGITSDANGNLYVTEIGNHKIRKIGSNNLVSTVAGNGLASFTDGDQSVATFSSPTAIAIGLNNELLIADAGNNRIRKIIDCSNRAIPTILLPSSPVICAGGSIRLTSSLPYRNLWSTGDTTRYITVNTPGTYTVQNASPNCTSLSSQPVTITTGIPSPKLAVLNAAPTPKSITGFTYINRVNSSDFYISNIGYSGYNGAKNACLNAGGQPATILNSQVNDMLAQAIPDGTTAYIGINDLDVPGNFVWPNNIAPTYLNWAPGEPSSLPNERAVRMDNTGLWDNVSIYRNIAVILETPIRSEVKLCPSSSFQVSTIAGASAYQWYKNDTALVNETSQNLTINAAGVYSAQVTYQSSCIGNSDTLTVVNTVGLPRPSINQTGNVNLCSGSSLTLTSSAESGNLWSTGETTRSINVTAAGTYRVQVIAGTCTSLQSFATTVSIIPTLETPSITGNLNLCAGGITTLYSSSPTGNYWSNGATSPSIIVNTPGEYSVQAISGTCTSAVSNIVVTTFDNPKPQMLANGFPIDQASYAGFTRIGRKNGKDYFLSNTQFPTHADAKNACVALGGNLANVKDTATNSLIANVISNNTIAYIGLSDIITEGSFIWSDSTSLAYSSWDFGQPSNSTSLNAVVINRNGKWSVVSTSSAHYAILEMPATDKLRMCRGQILNLQTNLLDNTNWYNNDTLVTIQNSSTLQVISAGKFQAEVTTGNNCSAKTNILFVTVDSLPQPVITAAGSVNFCLGESVILTSSIPRGNIWSTGDTTRSISARSTGSYTVVVAGSLCTTLNSNIIYVTATVQPDRPVIASTLFNLVQGDSAVLTILNPAFGGTYYWSNGAQGQRIVTRNNLRVTCHVIVNNCQSLESAEVIITDLKEKKLEAISAYPNPTTGFITIEGLDAAKQYSVKIYNTSGVLVRNEKLDTNGKLDISTYPLGLYKILISDLEANQINSFSVIRSE